MQTKHFPKPTSVMNPEQSISSDPVQTAGRAAPDASSATEPNFDDEGALDHPYFFVRKLGERIDTRGQPTAEFGHQIPSASYAISDGIFAQWQWDGKRLVVKNDRYGFYPMFWFSPPGGGVCISSSLDKLLELGAPTDLDIDALAVFFRLGNFVGDDTPFSAIKTVPPNAVFVWENGKLECRGRYPQKPDATTLTRDEAIDIYIDLFAKSMAKRVPATDKFAVPISGGRDSRHILLELHRTGFMPQACISALDNPPDPNEDPRVAAKLCRELRFEHVVVAQQRSTFSAEIRKNRETHFCTPIHGWYLAVSEFMNGHFECAYDGIAGDVLSQSKVLTPQIDAIFRTEDVNAICHALLSEPNVQPSRITGTLKGELKAARKPELATQRLAIEVEKHLGGPNSSSLFLFWNRTRRSIALAPYGLLSGVPRVYAPYLDHDLFDFLCSLPASMLMDRSFHDATIARAYPAFAHVPYVDDAAPLVNDRRERARFLAEAARAFVLKRPSRLMKNASPRARMLTSLFSMGRINPWVSPLVIYIDQIESMINRERRIPCQQA